LSVSYRRSAAALAVATAVGAGLLVPAWAWPAPLPTEAPSPNDPLAGAADAAGRVNFSGQVEVVWVDSVGQHQAALGVRASDGVVDLDGPLAVVADRQGRMVHEPGGWTLLWPDSDSVRAGVVPGYATKYRLTQGPGPSVAGRPTTEVVLRVGDEVRELVELDIATGLPLERAVLNADGTLVRVVRFESLVIASPGGAASTAPKAARSSAPRPATPTHLAAPFEAPADLAAGYHRVGLFHSADGLQVLYSDGVDTLSVFEEPGALGKGSLPRGRIALRVGSYPAAVWAWPGGQVATWQTGPAVFTVVGDGPLADLLAAAGSLPPAPAVSLSQRLRHACRRLVSELGLA
jgi:hypothetical protein